MIVQRDTYIEKLWSQRHNGLIKIVTGMRRSGKSFLLFNLFVKQLKDNSRKWSLSEASNPHIGTIKGSSY